MKDLKVYHNPGVIIKRIEGKNRIYYLDQLCESEVWVHSTQFMIRVKKLYGLTGQDYYNLVVYNNDYALIPKCPFCGRIKKFSNIGDKGYNYHVTCGRDECKSKAYSISNTEIQKNLVASGNHQFSNNSPHRLHINQRTVESNHKRALKGIHPCQDIKNNIMMQRGNFLSKGNPDDECYYYFSKVEGDYSKFKLGVTGLSLNKRESLYSFNPDTVQLRGIRLIVSGTRLQIADLEATVKLHFNSKSEYFPIEKFKKIMLYIKSLIK